MTQEITIQYRKPRLDLQKGCIEYDYGYKEESVPRVLKQVIVEGTQRNLTGALVGVGMSLENSMVVMTYPYRYGQISQETEVVFVEKPVTVLQHEDFKSLKAYTLQQFDILQQLHQTDQDLAVFVPIEALCQFEIMHQQWVTLRTADGKQAVAQVYSLNESYYPETEDQGVLIMSPTLFDLLKLSQEDTVTIKATDIEFKVADHVQLSSVYTSSNVELEMGNLPSGITLHKYRALKQKIVQKYFEQKRIVTDGMIIPLYADFYDMFDSEVSGQGDKQIQFMMQIHGVGKQFVAVDSTVSKVELDPLSINLPVPYGMFMPQEFDFKQLYPDHYEQLAQSLDNVLVQGEPESGIELLISQVGQSQGYHQHTVHCHSMAGYSSADIVTYIQQQMLIASQLAPCVVYLKDVDSIQVKPVGLAEEQHQANLVAKEERMIEQAISNALGQARQATDQKIVLVGSTCADAADVPKDILGLFDKQVKVRGGNKAKLLEHVVKEFAAADVDYELLAKDAVALQYHGIVKLTNYFKMSGRDQLLDHADMMSFIQEYQKYYTSRSKFSLVSIPNVTFEDVGGLSAAKEEIYNTLILPLQDPSQKNFSRTGLLFYGPPGCGKSMLAKAIANELRCTFLSVKGPELMNMYVGETEKNVRDLFSKAHQSKRAIIFFDELDSMAPRRESEAVMSRVVSQLLAEMDSVHSLQNDSMIFVIGATNRPDLLDSSLLRPGRFDRLVYLETPQTPQEQQAILKAATRKLKLHRSVDFDDICDMIPLRVWTGADYNAVCVEAQMLAIARSIEDVEQQMNNGKKRSKLTIQEYLTKNPVQVEIMHKDFAQAIDVANPSVSPQELEHYRKMQQQFRN